MSGLFGSLTMATRALEAQTVGLDVVGQNMANVNTAGYSRREVDFAEIPPYGEVSAGNGVQVKDIRAIRDLLLERRYRDELPDQQKAATMADTLSVVETALGDPGTSIDARFTAFFDSFAQLAQDPTSAIARQQVVTQASALAGSFRDMSMRLENARRDADTQITGAVDQVNSLATRIALLNVSIAKSNGAGAEAQHLKDEQGEAVRQLAQILDINVLQRQDGGVDITFGNGRALAIGEVAYALSATPTGPSGMSQLWINGANVTSEIGSGKIAGLLQVRDTLVPQYLTDLDNLAYSVTQQVNTLHAAGFDLNGAAGGTFFTPLASATGAASAISVDSAVAADPSLVAAAGIASAGDNQNARALAALRDGRVMFGNTATFSEAWGRIVYRSGTDSAAAKADRSSRAEIIRQLEALRDATSGVSLDEEAMMMLKFQRAYQANAKFFTTVNTTIDNLFAMVQ